MSRSKHDMLSEMISMIEKMDHVIQQACVVKGSLFFFTRHNLEDLEKLPADFIRPGYHWLKYVYDNQYQKAEKDLKLVPKEVWERYVSWGWSLLNESTESVIIKASLKDFKLAVSNRGKPDFFKRLIFRKVFKNATKSKASEKAKSECLPITKGSISSKEAESSI